VLKRKAAVAPLLAGAPPVADHQGWHLDHSAVQQRPHPIIAPTDNIGSAAIYVIGSAFGDIIGLLTPKDRTACEVICSA